MASERNTSTARLAEIRGVHRAKCALDGSETADLLAMIEERDALLRNLVSKIHCSFCLEYLFWDGCLADHAPDCPTARSRVLLGLGEDENS